MKQLLVLELPARHLLGWGEADSDALDTTFPGKALGLWFRASESTRLVASPMLAQLATASLNESEAVAAIFSCLLDLRARWLELVAARLREQGSRRDIRELIAEIQRLGTASKTLREHVLKASLTATGYEELERSLFGAAADQALAFPPLIRVLGLTAPLIEGQAGVPAKALADIDSLAPDKNWVAGRLLRLPSADESPSAKPTAVLPGSWAGLSEEEVGSDERLRSLMGWVLCRPWVFLLAQVAFTQEAWAAERSGSQLTLELPEDQFDHAYAPWRVSIIVSMATGEEVNCGSLGELIQRVLRRLGVVLLLPPGSGHRAVDSIGTGQSTFDLDERLAVVVTALLKQRVWRMADFSGLSPRRGYLIDEEFSNSCYRAFGNRHFSRSGSLVTAAIRNECELWARERLAYISATRDDVPHVRQWAGQVR